jgi:hypothetical protein
MSRIAKRAKEQAELLELKLQETESKRISEMKSMSKEDRAKKQSLMIAEAMELIDEQDEESARIKFIQWTNIDWTFNYPNDQLESLQKPQQLCLCVYNIKAKWIEAITKRCKELGYTVTIKMRGTKPDGWAGRWVEAELLIE